MIKPNTNLQGFLDTMSMDYFGIAHSKAIQAQVCVKCGCEAKEFKDALSAREYQISGLCQQCQDQIFDQ